MIQEDVIVNKVRSIMNEIGEDTTVALLDEDTIKIDEYIKSAIPEAVVLTIQNSPGRCVNPKSSTSASAIPNADGTGSVVLPDDFVTLIAFKMQGWRRIVSVAHEMDSEVYRQQSNPITRAGKCKPVCVLANNANGQRTLEYFSIGKHDVASVEMFVYEAQYDPLVGLNLQEGDALFGAVCYMCASLVYSIFENPATSAEMQKIALNLINDAVPHQ